MTGNQAHQPSVPLLLPAQRWAGRCSRAVRAPQRGPCLGSRTGRWAPTEQSSPQPGCHLPFLTRIPCSVCRITSTQAKHTETTQVLPLPSEVQSGQFQRLRLGLVCPQPRPRPPRVTRDPRCLQGSPLEPTSPQGQGDTPQRGWTALVPQEHLPAWHPPLALRPALLSADAQLCRVCAPPPAPIWAPTLPASGCPGDLHPALDSSSACQEAGLLPCCAPTRNCSPRAPPPALGTARPAPACPTGAGGCPSSSLTWGHAPGMEAAAGPPGSPDTTEDKDACFICLRTGAHTLLLQHGGVGRASRGAGACGLWTVVPQRVPSSGSKSLPGPGWACVNPTKENRDQVHRERACPPGSAPRGPVSWRGSCPVGPQAWTGPPHLCARCPRSTCLWPPACTLCTRSWPGDPALLRPTRSPPCSLLLSSE